MDLLQKIQDEVRSYHTRRWFFQQCGVGLGSARSGDAPGEQPRDQCRGGGGRGESSRSRPKTPHHPAKAKRLRDLPIPRQRKRRGRLDLFGTVNRNWRSSTAPCPRRSFPQGLSRCVHQPELHTTGACRSSSSPSTARAGAELSELTPHLAEIVDDVAIVKSMVTDAFNHAPAQIFMNTGSQQFGRPSFGAWTTYGLGSEGQDLPAYVVFSTGQKGTSGGAGNWGCGFLPTVYQGVPFRGQGDPVLFLSNPPGIDRDIQRDSLDALKQLNEQPPGRRRRPGDRHAHRVVRAGLSDAEQRARADGSLEGGPRETLALYGAEPRASPRPCQRLPSGPPHGRARHAVRPDLPRSVGSPRRPHGRTQGTVRKDRSGQAPPRLVKDLKRRGLLEDTLVIWGGEGSAVRPWSRAGTSAAIITRTPSPCGWPAAGSSPGSPWARPTTSSFNAVEDKVHVHLDLHATLLHLLGVDHTKLTYRFQGRDFRLTDVSGEVVKKLLA